MSANPRRVTAPATTPVPKAAPLAAITRTTCRHCGLPIPGERRARRDEFCCAGCARVFELLHAGGLERYYELRGERGTPVPELRESGMAWLDPLLAAGGDGQRPHTLTLAVQGVHCAACVWLLRELFLRREGALEVRINPARGEAELTFVPAHLDVRVYLAEVERFGYRFGPARAQRPPASRALLVRLGVCAAAAGNVMLFSLSLYAGLGAADGALYSLFGWLSLALTGIAVLVGGWVFFRSALAGLRLGVAHLDLPIALGIALAFAGSSYAHLAHGPAAAYYDTVATFVTLMLAGRFLQERVLERNRVSLLAADDVDGLVVRRVRDGALEPVRAALIEAGDELLVVPGELVPVAGVALGDGGTVALDWITGESEAKPVASGDEVPAGAFNTGCRGLRVAATEPFAASRLHALLARTDQDGERAPGTGGRFWTRLGTIYVAAVLVLAAAGALLWLPRGGEPALKVAVAILVVTCPCALGLAVPLARELVHVGLRRAGVFLREPGFLERALGVRTVLFDKTGTLTRGRLTLTGGSRAGLVALPGEARAALAAMAARSNHPASRALVEAIGDAGVASGDNVAAIEEVPGQGMEWRRGGVTWRLGRVGFAAAGALADASHHEESAGWKPAPQWQEESAGWKPAPQCQEESAGWKLAPRSQNGETWLSRDGEVVARFAFAEEIRDDVRGELARLAENGLEVRVLSGDRPERVRAVAAAIGVRDDRAEGGLDPEAKAARVRALDRDDTLMVGDGINDAPSFAAAYCTATPAVDRPHLPARADLYYVGDGIAAVRRALAAARLLRRAVWANLGFALAYNTIALALAFAGLITPLAAAVLMPASSLTVVGHTLLRLAGRGAAWTS